MACIRFWALNVKYEFIRILRSQFFEYLRETLYKHALEHLEAARLEKWGRGGSSYGKRVTIIDLFEGLWLIGTHFRR